MSKGTMNWWIVFLAIVIDDKVSLGPDGLGTNYVSDFDRLFKTALRGCG